MCIAAIAPILSGVVSGIGAAQSAKANAASLEGQAAFKKRQAEMETTAGGYKAERLQDEGARVGGAQRAGFAANGIALSGSAEDVILDSAQENALDVASVRWNSALTADNLRYQAKMDQMNAKQERRAAPLAFLGPVISGVGSGIASFQSSFA